MSTVGPSPTIQKHVCKCLVQDNGDAVADAETANEEEPGPEEDDPQGTNHMEAPCLRSVTITRTCIKITFNHLNGVFFEVLPVVSSLGKKNQKGTNEVVQKPPVLEESAKQKVEALRT